MFVEFFGLPGSGKTTVAELVTNDKKGGAEIENIHAGLWKMGGRRRFSLLGYAFYFVLREPSATLRYFIAMSNGSQKPSVVMYLYLKLALMYGYLKRGRCNPSNVSEQWLLQLIWSLGIRKGVPGSFRRDLLRLLNVYKTKRVLVAYFSLSTEEAARRVKAREHGASLYDGMNDAGAIAESMDDDLVYMNNIVDELERKGVNVIRLNASSSPYALAKLIDGALSDRTAGGMRDGV